MSKNINLKEPGKSGRIGFRMVNGEKVYYRKRGPKWKLVRRKEVAHD
jgi:hypothetical protein